jgi:aryl-alcohol dehydrogenase-like predicted oxidoreductase
LIKNEGGGCFDRSLPVDAAKLDILEQLVVLADEIGCTLAELALAFVVATPR